MKINLEYIKTFDPCQSGVDEYVKAGHESFNGTVLEFLDLKGVPISNKLWVVLRKEIIPENDLHELACKFAESVLHIYEKEYPNDDRPRKAIEARRKYIKGEITRGGLEDAMAAWDTARYAARAASDAAWDTAKDTAWAAWYAAKDTEQCKQLNTVKDYFMIKKNSPYRDD